MVTITRHPLKFYNFAFLTAFYYAVIEGCAETVFFTNHIQYKFLC